MENQIYFVMTKFICYLLDQNRRIHELLDHHPAHYSFGKLFGHILGKRTKIDVWRNRSNEYQQVDEENCHNFFEFAYFHPFVEDFLFRENSTMEKDISIEDQKIIHTIISASLPDAVIQRLPGGSIRGFRERLSPRDL